MKESKTTKTSPQRRLPYVFAFAFISYIAQYNHNCWIFTLRLIGEVSFLISYYTPLKYHKSELYLSVLDSQWNKLKEVEATPVPEIDIDSFSREKFLKLSEHFSKPIVIRNALKSSGAVQRWTPEYLKEKYFNETVVVREMIGTNLRVQHRTLNEFFHMRESGRNVSVIASSGIFYRSDVMKTETLSEIENDLKGPLGDKIDAFQLFMSPGGRSFYHSEMGTNVFRQIEGEKLWNVIDPMYNYFLCPYPVITATSVNTCIVVTLIFYFITIVFIHSMTLLCTELQ